MEKWVPIMYKKSIFDVDYDKLKDMGIKCLLFDLDNTLIEARSTIPTKETVRLIEGLNKDFDVFVISNSPTQRLEKIKNNLPINYYAWSFKPSKRNFRKVLKKYSKEEIILIGDQFVTDVFGSIRVGIKVVLVDPLSSDLACTKFNRYLEDKIIKKLGNENLFFKGKYYD